MTWSPFSLTDWTPDRDRFLPDVQVAEATDQAHAVELAGPFLERRISSIWR